MDAYKFKLPPNKGKLKFNAESVTIRESGGEDEKLASQVATAKGDEGDMGIEMIRMCIVEVDGKPVRQPFVEFDTWNTATRKAVAKYYNSINVVKDADLDPLIEAAVPVAVRQPLSAVATAGEDG